MEGLRTYALAPTLIAIPVAATSVAITPPANCAGFYLKSQGGGTLALVLHASGAGASAANGYNFVGNEVMDVKGPAQFFLNAGGATAVAAIVFKRTAGFSQIIGG